MSAGKITFDVYQIEILIKLYATLKITDSRITSNSHHLQMYKAVHNDIKSDIKIRNFLNTIDQIQVNIPSLKSP